MQMSTTHQVATSCEINGATTTTTTITTTAGGKLVTLVGLGIVALQFGCFNALQFGCFDALQFVCFADKAALSTS